MFHSRGKILRKLCTRFFDYFNFVNLFKICLKLLSELRKIIPFSKKLCIKNNSVFECTVNNDYVKIPIIPDFPDFKN